MGVKEQLRIVNEAGKLLLLVKEFSEQVKSVLPVLREYAEVKIGKTNNENLTKEN